MGIATFTYDNFITNNSYCPVISHKIVASLKTNSAPSYITISEGATQFVIKNVSMSSFTAVYDFYIVATASGGAYLK